MTHPDPAHATERRLLAGLLQVDGAAVPTPPVAQFVARDKFVVDLDGDVPISLIGEDFTKHFLALVERDVPAATLSTYRLVKGTIDAPIFAALGGDAEAKVALAQMFAYLKVANRDNWYFFYVADAQGKLWAIDVYWRDGGWDLECYSTTYPRGWRGGGRIVSR